LTVSEQHRRRAPVTGEDRRPVRLEVPAGEALEHEPSFRFHRQVTRRQSLIGRHVYGG
jgi:hypothetical protein